MLKFILATKKRAATGAQTLSMVTAAGLVLVSLICLSPTLGIAREITQNQASDLSGECVGLASKITDDILRLAKATRDENTLDRAAFVSVAPPTASQSSDVRPNESGRLTLTEATLETREDALLFALEFSSQLRVDPILVAAQCGEVWRPGLRNRLRKMCSLTSRLIQPQADSRLNPFFIRSEYKAEVETVLHEIGQRHRCL